MADQGERGAPPHRLRRRARRAIVVAGGLLAAAAWYAHQHATGALERDWWIPLAVLGVIFGGGATLGQRAGRRFGGSKRQIRR